MTTLTEGQHSLEFVVSEANGARSRKIGTLITGQNLAAGTVLGVITASGKYTQFDQDAATGEEAAAGVLAYACDATSADASCVIIARDAEVNGAELVWPGDIEVGEKATAIASLASAGIIVR
jgi:hypothetical protein